MQGQSTSDAVSFEWMRLWSLLIPAKVKNFVWRLVHDCLPTLSNLRRRRMDVNVTCPVCKSSEECLDYMLYLCPFSKKCWELAKLAVPCAMGVSVSQWMSDVFKSYTLREIELLCTIAWNIWAHRNSVVWKNHFQSPLQVVNGARSVLVVCIFPFVLSCPLHL